MKTPDERIEALEQQSANVGLCVDDTTFASHLNIVRVERAIAEVKVATECCKMLHDLVQKAIDTDKNKVGVLNDILDVTEVLSDKYVV